MANDPTIASEPGEPTKPSPLPSHLGQLIVVDDEEDLLSALQDRLTAQGYQVAAFSSAREALHAIQNDGFDLLLTDVMMPEMDGLTLLRSAREIDPHLVGVMMTGQATIQTAVDAMKLGAVDYILKPFKSHIILPVLARALEMRRLRFDNLSLRETLAVHELCQAISFSLDRNTILNRIVDAALQQCEADEGSVMLPTTDRDELYVGVVRGKNREGLLGERVPFTSGVAGWVARERQPVVLQGAVRDSRFAPLWPRTDIRAAVSLPMLAGGKLVGVLNVNTTRQRTITMGNIKALNILASVGGAAIQSANLFTEARQAEEKYRSIFDRVAEGIFRITPEGRFALANPATARILDYPSPEALVEQVTDFPGQVLIEANDWANHWRPLEDHDKLETLEEAWRRKGGDHSWLSIKVRTVRDSSGQVMYYEGSAEDITGRKQAERRQAVQYQVAGILAEARDLSEAAPRLLQALCNNSDYQTSALWSVDARTRVLRCVAFWGRFGFEYSKFEKVTRRLTFTRGQGLPGRVWENGQPASIPDVTRDNNFLRAAAAKEADVRTALAFPINLGREVLGVLEFFTRDVRPLDEQTQQMFAVIGNEIGQFLGRRRLQDSLLQSQKMEAIGVLAGGVAHDFNNLLTIINGYSEILLARTAVEHGDRDFLHGIYKAGERAATLTRQLLAFSRKQVFEPVVLNMNNLLREDEKMLRRVIGEDIELIVALAEDLLSVQADAGQIEQVILNLAVNARDAMPQGGRLAFETCNAAIGETRALQHPEAKPGTYVVLTVRDTGIGMDAATQARIFEPFYTTKEVGKGTGLGLATVYGIVQQAKGFIELDSEPGRGTTFRVCFPAVRERSATPLGRSDLPGTQVNEEVTVLLVEDEPSVRAIARMTLEGQGYRILEASNGQEALAVAEQYPKPIHLLLTDVVMPRMSGSQLAEQLTALRPEMKVVFVSGFAGDMLARHGVAENATVIAKPFSPMALAHKIAGILLNENEKPSCAK